jgi:DinB family protein
MERDTLLVALDFSRNKLLNTLDLIEKSGQDPAKVLAWRPGPGRAHIGWQAMHCAATHDKYVNVNLKGGKARDEARVTNFGGGSTPSDQNVPDLASIRAALETDYRAFRDYVGGMTPADFGRKLASGRTIGESIVLLTWHEAHHQGQIHLTWNLYKQAHGIA